jgi:VanZ family protein
MASWNTRLGKLVAWVWYWLPPLILMAVIFYASSRSSLPQAQSESVDALIKKISHIAEYTLLFLLLARAWRWTLAGRPAGSEGDVARALWVALLTTMAYAISDEVHQAFVPRRHASWVDVVIDVAVPVLLCLLWYRRRSFLRTRHPDLAE